MSVWCGAFTDLNGLKRTFTDFSWCAAHASKALAVDKFVFAIMSGPQTKTTHSSEPQPRGMSTIEPVGSLRALALFCNSPAVYTQSILRAQRTPEL